MTTAINALLSSTINDDGLEELKSFINSLHPHLDLDMIKQAIEPFANKYQILIQDKYDFKSSLSSVNQRLTVLETELADLRSDVHEIADLVSPPIGLNVVHQLCILVHLSFNYSIASNESYANFLQRSTLSTAFISRVLSPGPPPQNFQDLQNLRTGRNDHIHGIHLILTQLIKIKNSSQLMTHISNYNPFAASGSFQLFATDISSFGSECHFILSSIDQTS